MSRVYYWSDQHFGDPTVARLRGYSSVKDHDSAVAEAWVSTVTKRDTVYMLGDVCRKGRKNEDPSLGLISSLPGSKRLVMGNHDALHPLNQPSVSDWNRWGWVFDSMDMAVKRRVGGVAFLLSHFPYRGDHKDEDRHVQWRLPDLGLPLVHGHVHHLWRERENMLNTGVERNPLPVTQEEVEEWISTLQSN